MNAGDQCLARIAAVQLRLPELSDRNARNELDEEDRLITSEALRRLGGVRKASPDDPKHPGWPAGTPDGRGGKFRPKGAASALTDKVKNIVARDQLRMNLAAALHVGIEALINLIPGLDVAADVMMVAEIARTMSEYRKLATDAVAALNFVQNGPYSLEDLQVSSDYKQFSSYDAFLKDSPEFDIHVEVFRASWWRFPISSPRDPGRSQRGYRTAAAPEYGEHNNSSNLVA